MIMLPTILEINGFNNQIMLTFENGQSLVFDLIKCEGLDYKGSYIKQYKMKFIKEELEEIDK